MLGFLNIIKNPLFWKILILSGIVMAIGIKFYSMSSTIDKLEFEKKELASNLTEKEKELTIEKVANMQNKQTIEKYKYDIAEQNNAIKEKELDVESLAKIIEENKKNPPSSKVITKYKNIECNGFTKFKGMKYEDL